MNNPKIIAVCAVLLCAFCITACDWIVDSGTRFDYRLEGTWASSDTSVYSGRLEITYDTITITGYDENQTPPRGDDNRRPFKDFTKRTPLSGYSEKDSLDETSSSDDAQEGKMYIRDAGTWQAGISYVYYEGNRGQDKFLRFSFGGRTEILRWLHD